MIATLRAWLLYRRGVALLDGGQLAEAERCFARVIALDPGRAGAFVNRGAALYALGRVEDAARCLIEAVAVHPGYAQAQANLGVALYVLDRLEDAERAFRAVTALRPGSAEAHLNLGNTLMRLGRAEEAAHCFKDALRCEPDLADAHINLGIVLNDLRRLGEAEESLRRALALAPDSAEAHNNLGNVLTVAARVEEAVQCYRRALALRPDYADAHSNLIFALDMMPEVPIAEQQQERRRWYAAHAQKYAGSVGPHANDADPERKLRIGYVSADFRTHSAYYVFGPVLRGHDHANLEVYCYSGVRIEDGATARLRQAADVWCRCSHLPDDALDAQIRSDRIDVLVDLSGHSRGNRLLVFARKPAPVQVTAWGHATGTGLATMDYFLADPVFVPQAERRHFAEEVFDLPCWACYEAPAYMPEVSPLPASGGQPATFGCVTRIEKISDPAIALWGRILAAVPEGVLLIKGNGLDEADFRQRLLERLKAAAIGPERVRLFGSSPHAEHLRIFHQFDVGLDTFPQGGGVGTAEALWMGVPVVTLPGPTPPGRASGSFLNALQMQDWIARDEEDYVRIAVEASRNLPRLADLRRNLRARMAATAIGDARKYAQAVEAAYRTMWRRWCERR